jgi:hypothetical protein
MNTALDTLFETIAREVLRIPTLATRGWDSLDFHEVGVLSIKEALHLAYLAGCAATTEQFVSSNSNHKGDRL